MKSMLSLLVVPIVVAASPAFAEEVASGDGYFPDTPRQGAAPVYTFGPPRSPVRLGGSFSLGAAVVDWDTLDADFFEPNGAGDLDVQIPAAIDFNGYLEFAGLVRVGADALFLVGGDGQAYAGSSAGGLLLEIGGGDKARVFGGTVIGFQTTYASSRDSNLVDLEYRSADFHVRLHVNAEYEISPFASVRFTPFATFGRTLSQDFYSEGPLGGSTTVVVPDESEFNFMSFGAMFGVALHTW
jgi:hypothetical protein